MIENFIEMIKKNKDKLKSEEVLTMNVLYEEACRLEKKMLRDTNLSGEKCEEFRLKVEDLYSKMRDKKPSPLT